MYQGIYGGPIIRTAVKVVDTFAEEVVQYRLIPISAVIEAAVTNNVGYQPVRERLDDVSRGILDKASGRKKLSDSGRNLYYDKLSFARVVPTENFERRIPVIYDERMTFIQMPNDLVY